MNELHLFAGAGGGILGGMSLGHTPCCAVEINPYARKVLIARQRDGMLPRFPIWDDITTFDAREWRGIADVVCGGFPCQDISAGNANGQGLNGKRSGLWGEMARVVREVEPRFVFVENSPMLLVRGMGVVIGDLAEMGYDARWGVYSANDVGAPHERKRIWIMGYAPGERLPEGSLDIREHSTKPKESAGTWGGRRVDKPGIVGVVDGVADWVDRLTAAGNGQVPRVASNAWKILGENDQV